MRAVAERGAEKRREIIEGKKAANDRNATNDKCWEQQIKQNAMSVQDVVYCGVVPRQCSVGLKRSLSYRQTGGIARRKVGRPRFGSLSLPGRQVPLATALVYPHLGRRCTVPAPTCRSATTQVFSPW